MSRATVAQSFPQTPGSTGINAVLVDTPNAANKGRTTGQQLAIPLDVTPPPGQQWTLLGYGISATIYLAWGTPGTISWLGLVPFGRLGKLIAGITYNEGAQPNGDLPADASLVSTVWDGQQDPTPPINPLSAGPLTLSRFLPQDVPLESGIQLSFGLWLTPSVINALFVVVKTARAVVYYDTG